jgi:hypothetical protein
MRLFFKQLLLFITPSLIIFPLLDWYISNGLKKSDYHGTGETFIWNEIIEGNINADLYIYGSSRAWVHFDAQMIEDSLEITSYNFGIDGHNFWLQYLRHKLLLQHNPQPKVILLSVDMFGFNKQKDLYNSRQFLPYIFNKDIYKYTSEYNGFNWFEYHLPFIRYYGRTKDILESIRNKSSTYYSKVYRYKGFRGISSVWTRDLINAKKKIGSFKGEIHQPYVSLMEDFLEECKTLGVEVVLVYTPEYIEGQKFLVNKEEFISIYEGFSKEHDLVFLNYSDHDICFERDLFYNSQHLNGEGASRFIEILINDLKSNKKLSDLIFKEK